MKYFVSSYESGTLFLAEEAEYECNVKPQPKTVCAQQNNRVIELIGWLSFFVNNLLQLTLMSANIQ